MTVSWVTVVWSMIASACLTLAAMYFLVWFKNRDERPHLLFSLSAASMTAFAFCELWMMRATTPDELMIALRWAHVPLFSWLLSTTWFVRVYLRAGRGWLAWTILIVRALMLIVNFQPGQNLTYRSMLPLAADTVPRRSGDSPGRRRQSVAAGHADHGDPDPGVCRRCERDGLAARRPAKGVDRRRQRRVQPC